MRTITSEESLEKHIYEIEYRDHDYDVGTLFFELDFLMNDKSIQRIQDNFNRQIIDARIRIIKKLIMGKPLSEKYNFYKKAKKAKYFARIFNYANVNIESIFDQSHPKSKEEIKSIESLKRYHLERLELFRKEFILPYSK
jgi:hypothetical protein